MLTPELKMLGDQVIAAIKSHVAGQVGPLLDAQRELLVRLDKQAQQISALTKQVAAIERKAK